MTYLVELGDPSTITSKDIAPAMKWDKRTDRQTDNRQTSQVKTIPKAIIMAAGKNEVGLSKEVYTCISYTCISQ